MTDQTSDSSTYLWYDYETFGTDPRKDRPVQFGALRTNTDFNPIGKPMVIYAQLADDYLPSPAASLVTGITPMTLMEEENALVEAEFANLIFEEMNKPGTLSIGYNNRAYDDEMTRFTFWRNLLPPYETEFGEGRGRFDIYLLVLAVYALCPEILNWPTKEDGSVTFKLDHLTPANHLQHSHAHDASSDAFATMQLAKLIRSKNPGLWNYALKINSADELVAILEENRPLLYIDKYSMHERRGIRPIMPLFRNPTVKNEWICWDLNFDPKEMWTISEKDMEERSFITREKRAQGIKPLGFVRIRLKKQPFLMKGMKTWMDSKGKDLFEQPSAFYIERAREIENSRERLNEILPLFMHINDLKTEAHEKDIPEEALYSGGFPSERDKFNMAKLRRVQPEEMDEVYSRMSFDREDLSLLALYFLGRNYPEYALNNKTEKLWRLHKFNKLVNGEGGSRSFEKFYEELVAAREKATDAGQAILDDVEGYVEDLRGEYGV